MIRSIYWLGEPVHFDFDNDGSNKDLFTANSEILDNAMEVEHRPYALPNSRISQQVVLSVFEDLSAAERDPVFHCPGRASRSRIW